MRELKRPATLVVVVGLIGALFQVGAVRAADFTDVPAGAFYEDAVEWLAAAEITAGTSPTTYSPNEFVTRGQMAAFLARFGSADGSSPEAGFSDVPAGAFFDDAVDWLLERGITTGTSPTTYSPNDFVTRAQMAAFLWRFAGRVESDTAVPFTDVPAGTFYTEAVAWLVENGITTGTSPTTYSPDEFVTRGQMAAFLWRLAGEPAANEVGDNRNAATPVAAAGATVTAGEVSVVFGALSGDGFVTLQLGEAKGLPALADAVSLDLELVVSQAELAGPVTVTVPIDAVDLDDVTVIVNVLNGGGAWEPLAVAVTTSVVDGQMFATFTLPADVATAPAALTVEGLSIAATGPQRIVTRVATEAGPPPPPDFEGTFDILSNGPLWGSYPTVSPDGATLVYGDRLDDELFVYDYSSMTQVDQFAAVSLPTALGGDAVLSPDGTVYFGSSGNLWKRDTALGVSTMLADGLGSSRPRGSSDGRYISFASSNPNTADPGDDNNGGGHDVFYLDTMTGDFSRVTSGSEASGDTSPYRSEPWSDDGAYMIFHSEDDLNGDGETNGTVEDLYLYDRVGDTVERITAGTSTDALGRYTISGDGSTVYYTRGAHIFAWTRASSTTMLVASGNDVSGAGEMSVSNDGRFLAFDTRATDLETPAAPAATNLYVWDKNSAELTRVTDASGTFYSGFSMDASGEVIVFLSQSEGLTDDDDANGGWDVFTWHRSSGDYERVTNGSLGVFGFNPVGISDNGHTVWFYRDTGGPDGIVLHLWDRGATLG